MPLVSCSLVMVSLDCSNALVSCSLVMVSLDYLPSCSLVIFCSNALVSCFSEVSLDCSNASCRDFRSSASEIARSQFQCGELGLFKCLL